MRQWYESVIFPFQATPGGCLPGFELASSHFGVPTVPAHTPWCILLFQSKDKEIAFSGDFFVNHIPSQPLSYGRRKADGEIGGVNHTRHPLKRLKLMGLKFLPWTRSYYSRPIEKWKIALKMIAKHPKVDSSHLACSKKEKRGHNSIQVHKPTAS